MKYTDTDTPTSRGIFELMRNQRRERSPKALEEMKRLTREWISRNDQRNEVELISNVRSFRLKPENAEESAGGPESTESIAAQVAEMATPSIHTPAALSLPAAATAVIGKVLTELSEATSDEELERKSETLVLLAKDFCDAVTFMGEASAQYQQQMSRAAENKSIIAGRDLECLQKEQEIDTLHATYDARKRTQVSNEETKATDADARFNAAAVRAKDRRQSIDADAVQQRMIARQTVIDAILGHVTISNNNYYRAFARLLYDHFADRHDDESALEKAAAVLAARMNEDDFDRAAGSEFYNLFTKRRADSARAKLDAHNNAWRERELSHEETLTRLKTDEARHKAQRIQNLKDLAGHGHAFDPTV